MRNIDNFFRHITRLTENHRRHFEATTGLKWVNGSPNRCFASDGHGYALNQITMKWERYC